MIRHPSNPIITRESVPQIAPELIDVTSIFNPGAIEFNNEVLLLLRVQNRGRETFILKAIGENYIDFEINPQIIRFEGIDRLTRKIYHFYDPRITKIDNEYYIVFAMDTDEGCRLGIAATDNFDTFTFIGMISDNDSRNGVLFPEKINNKFLLLERPNRSISNNNAASGDEILLSESNDLISWTRIDKVMSGRKHYWDELIGPGPPPVKTSKGWLLIYHGVATHFQSVNIYQAGVALLDINQPHIVKQRGRYNILEPRESYELVGQVPNVVFPTGMVVEQYDEQGTALDSSKVHIYYGAADSAVCLATSTVAELLEACKV